MKLTYISIRSEEQFFLLYNLSKREQNTIINTSLCVTRSMEVINTYRYYGVVFNNTWDENIYYYEEEDD